MNGGKRSGVQVHPWLHSEFKETILKKQQEQNISETFKNLQKFILFVHFLWKALEDVQKTINPKKQSKGKSEHHNWGINQKNNS